MAEAGWNVARQTGHFGEFLQGRLGPEGPVVLVTAPCPSAVVEAAWQPGGNFSAYTPGLRLAPWALRELFRDAGHPIVHGRLRISANQPAGSGCGISTASLLAVRKALGPVSTPHGLAALTASIEGATDPLMMQHAETHLWASRQGRSLRRTRALPRLEIVGGFLGPAELTDPEDDGFADVSDLVDRWEKASAKCDAAELGAIATASALRNRHLRGGADLEAVAAEAKRLGAFGLLAAHTGSAVGLIFAPGKAPEATPATLRALGLGRILRFSTGGLP